MTIRDGFMAFAKKYNMPLNEKNENGMNILSFYISGEKGKYYSFAMCVEEENLLAFFVDCNIRVEKQNRAVVSEYLMNINYQLKAGNFLIDPNTGDVSVRICQYIFGSEEEQQALIERVVLLAGMIADNYCHEIVKYIP